MQGPKFDIGLKDYLEMIDSGANFKSKSVYALHCIYSCLLPTNPNLLHNKSYVGDRLSTLLPIAHKYPESSILQPMGAILNILNHPQSQLQFLSIIKEHEIQGEITDPFTQQFQQLAKKLVSSPKHTQYVISVVVHFISNYSLSQTQTDTFLTLIFDWIDDNTLLLPLNVCFKLLNASTFKITALLNIIDRVVVNTNPKQLNPQEMVGVLEGVCRKHWLNEQVKYLCSVIMMEINKDESLYYLFLGQTSKQWYFPSGNIHSALKNPASQFEFIVDYFYKEAKESKQFQKCICVGKNMEKAKINMVNRIISNAPEPVDEELLFKAVPLMFLKSPEMVLRKLTSENSPYNVIESLKYFDRELKIAPEILLVMMKISLVNPEYKLISQCQFLIANSVNEQFLQDKVITYALFLPIVCSDPQKYQNNLQHIFSYDRLKVQEKFYIFRWIVDRQNALLVRSFFNNIFLIIDKEPNVYRQFYYFFTSECKKEWLMIQFKEEIDKLLEKVLSHLPKKQPKYAINLMFQFHKFNMFGQWQSLYRWALTPLLHIHDPDLTVDYLQIFEVLSEESAPTHIKKKFLEILSDNWPEYNKEHLFGIERIINCLLKDQYDEYTYEEGELKDIALKSIKQKHKESEMKQLIVKGFSLLFEEDQQLQTDLNNLIMKTLATNPPDSVTLHCQNLLMWRYQYSDLVLPKGISSIAFKQLCRFQELKNFEVCRNWFQIIATLPHEENILSLPLGTILRQLGHNKDIVKFCSEVCTSIIDVNVSSLGKFKLSSSISVLLAKLTVCSHQLGSEIVDFISNILYVEDSPYKEETNLHIIQQVIRSQFTIPSTQYRPTVVEFCLQAMTAPHQSLASLPKYMEHIIYKYIKEQTIIKLCLLYHTKHHLPLSQSVLMRIKHNHKKSEEIVSICEELIKELKPKEMDVIILTKKQSKIQRITEIEPKPQPKPSFIQFKQEPKEQAKQEPEVISQTPVTISSPEKKVEVLEQKSQESPTKSTSKSPKVKTIKMLKLSDLAQLEGDEEVEMTINQIDVDLPTTVFDLTTLKKHMNFIESLKSKLSEEEDEKFYASVEYIKQTVKSHHYYCKKVVGMGIVSKLQEINRLNDEKYTGISLKLFKELCLKKQKNLIVFGDEKAIEFLKRALKNSLLSGKSSDSNADVLSIIRNNRNCMKYFYQYGLLSMLVELAKNKINEKDILNYFVTNDLHINVINEIYQRGLLLKMQQVLKNGEILNDEDIQMLGLWIRLAGKICVNAKIREKLASTGVHESIFNRIDFLKQSGLLLHAVQFYGSWCYNFERACEWAMKQKLPQYFLQEIDDEEYYRFFHYFSLNNKASIAYLHRIKYFNHMVGASKQKQSHKKHFYKSFKYLVNSDNFKVILKESLVKYFIDHYEQSNQESIYDFIYKLVLALPSFEEFKQIEKQGFWKSLELFDYKLKDDGVYPHLLRIYIHLLTKYGVTKSIDNPYLAIKVIRKGVFSINLDGKRLTLQYIVLLSQLQKLYYGRPRCLEILQSLLRYDLSDEQINLCHRLLVVKKYPSALAELEKAGENQKPILTPKTQNEAVVLAIVELISNKFRETVSQSTDSKTRKLMEILALLCYSQQAAVHVNKQTKAFLLHYFLIATQLEVDFIEHCLDLMISLIQYKKIRQAYLLDSANLIHSLMKLLKIFEQTQPPIIKKTMTMLKLFSSDDEHKQALAELVDKIQQHPFLSKSSELKAWCNQFHKQAKFNTNVNEKEKIRMKEGVKVKMYKVDGSTSELILFFTQDFMELNCVASKDQAVKPKWKLPLKDIHTLQTYSDDNKFKKSLFNQATGLFSKPPSPSCCLSLLARVNPFYIGFETKSKREEWELYIEWGRYNSGKIFSMIK